MTTKRKVFARYMTVESGMVFIKGELYGWENEFWQDVEDGKIEYIEPTVNEIKKESGEHLLDAEYWSEPY